MLFYLKSPTDYRKIDRPSQGSHFFPPTGKDLKDVLPQAEAHADRWFNYFSQGKKPEFDVELHIWGRPVTIPKCVVGVAAQFTFQELCCRALSAADYLEITRNFPCIVITDIPLLSVRGECDVTRRFITFLDAAYESGTKMAVTAERPFEHLFTDEIPKYEDTANIVKEVASKTASTAPETAEKKGKELDFEGDLLENNELFSGDERAICVCACFKSIEANGVKKNGMSGRFTIRFTHKVCVPLARHMATEPRLLDIYRTSSYGGSFCWTRMYITEKNNQKKKRKTNFLLYVL